MVRVNLENESLLDDLVKNKDENGLGEFLEENVKEFAEVWKNAANRELQREAQKRGYEYPPILKSVEISDPYESPAGPWGGQQTTVDLEWEHPAASFWNYGTEPHTIEAKDAHFLAFEWDNAPMAIRSAFSGDPPLVFQKEAEVDGIDAMHFIERGRKVALRWAKNTGDLEDVNIS